MLRSIFISVMITGAVIGCASSSKKLTINELQESQTPKAVSFPEHNWISASPSDFGWDTVVLNKLTAGLKKSGTNAMLIVQNGKVIYQFGDLSTPHIIRSARKSIMSALYGPMVSEGKISLLSTLKDLKIEDVGGLSEIEKSATVRDLLMARSGVYHAPSNVGDEPNKPARNSQTPGQLFVYNNWDFNVLGTIYENASGLSAYEAVNRVLAIPLGMQDYKVSLQKYKDVPQVSMHKAYHFTMSARDLARFGLLYLNNGNWNGNQIIPEKWVKESTQELSYSAHKDLGYGYLWWTIQKNSRLKKHQEILQGAYMANGTGGQKVIVIPKLKAVIVHTVDTDLVTEENAEGPDAEAPTTSIEGDKPVKGEKPKFVGTNEFLKILNFTLAAAPNIKI